MAAPVIVRFLRSLNSLKTTLETVIGISAHHGPALAVAGAELPREARRHDPLLRDGLLWAVPKKRRSIERNLKRRLGFHKHLEFGTPRRDIVACVTCGNWKEQNTICGHCYTKVKEETKSLKSLLPEALKFEAPRRETVFLYKGEGKEGMDGKYVVEVDKNRPSWFPSHLTQKKKS